MPEMNEDNLEENTQPTEEQQQDGEHTAEDNPASSEEETSDETERPAIEYIGKEELEHFLALLNTLGDKKYLRTGDAAEYAINAGTADRLNKDVYINGQAFNGTQDITFDEYAQKTDVLFKKDCAQSGSEDNGGKVVILNSDGKVDSEYFDSKAIEENVSAAIKLLKDETEQNKEFSKKEIDDIRSQQTNFQSTLKNFANSHGMRQQRVTITKDNVPACVTINAENDLSSCCAPPIEVLKDISGNKNSVLDFKQLQYGGVTDFEIFGISPQEIILGPIAMSMLILPESVEKDVTLYNYKEHRDAWIIPKAVSIEDEESYLLTTNAITVSPEYKINSYIPQGTFHYAVIDENNIIYNIKDGKLVKGVSATEDADIAVEVQKSDANATVTTEMVLEVLPDKAFSLVLCAKNIGNPTPADMTLIMPESEIYTAVPREYLNFFGVDTIVGFTPHYECSNEGSIRFGIIKSEAKESSDENASLYYVWDKEAEDWKNVNTLADMAKEGLGIEELEKMPEKAWSKADGREFSFIFSFSFQNYNSLCVLNDIVMSYKNRPLLVKATHGIDYNYAYAADKNILMFNNEGKYIINYFDTDTMAKDADESSEAIVSKMQLLLS